MSKPMGHVGITLFGLYFIVLSIFSAYVIIKVWPDPAAAAEAAELPAIKLLPFLPPLELGIEVRLSLIAALAGALGAFVHAATSFSSYVGNRELKRSWGWWYGLRPFIGMVMGVLFYFFIRGGILGPQATGNQISAYGVAALAGLAGLFSKQAVDKLKDVFEHIFPTAEDTKRGDKLSD